MNWTDKIKDMRGALRAFNTLQPATAKGFGALGKAAKEPKALDAKTVEFVALGIAVADRCEPCIAFHIDALVRLGASRDEIGEVLSMCVQMGGGPSLMYAAKALECFDELAEPARN
ncbi:carboxymuconolactone decarboxylase family protein [Meridianimarinicoccus roseus]|uniref:Carboxymuconolactone decarboxylase family protein n=1 Tax=Meridianimarinicoccus roseus TaxID=2072018 RepID=A0A2V2LCR8_9RHOB|nr:carboxymuconolactone decarboxylase family protein [Meridianimarinicoccus roseus]PWR01314.1 carboxymuconolactone decarboxylase family protein [Meridianimarinicoccus roseus]